MKKPKAAPLGGERISIELEVDGDDRVVHSAVTRAARERQLELLPAPSSAPPRGTYPEDAPVVAIAPPAGGAIDAAALRYKSGSRATPYPREDGAMMIKTTFHATWELDVVLSSFAATLRAREARNAWIERVIMDAIRAENGQEWIDDVLELAERKERGGVGRP